MSDAAEAQRLILRGGGAAGLGFLVRLGARLLFLFAAARLFGATLFGAYVLALAMVELVVTIGGLGAKRILFILLEDDASARPPIHIVLDAAIVVLAASFALAGMIMAAIAILPAWLAGETAFALFLIAPMIAGQALLDLLLAATRWKHKMRYEVVGRSIVEPYAAIIAALAAWSLGFQATGLLITYWAGTLAALGYAIYGLRHCLGSFQWGLYRPSRASTRAILAASTVPTFHAFINGLFGRLDLYLVGAMLGEAPAGVYGMVRQLRTPIRQVRQSFDSLLTPLVARTLAANGPRDTGRATASATRLILAIQLPILIILILVGRPLLEALGPGFAIGYWALVVLAIAEVMQGALGVPDLIFLYRRPMMMIRVTAVSIVVTLGTALLWISAYGLDGAAFSVLAGAAAGALTRRWLLRTSFGIATPLSYSAGPVAACLAAVAVSMLAFEVLRGTPGILFYGGTAIGALLTYAAALKLWLSVTGDSLALVDFKST